MNFRTRTVLIAVTGAVLLLAPFQTYALNSERARYDSGTITQIPKAQTGKLTAEDGSLRFEWKKGDYAIPYASIVDMEYGDRPSVRIGTLIGVASVCQSCGPKVRYDLLTLEFTQGTTKQAVVFELGKALRSTLLPALAMKTGREIAYQQMRAVTLAGLVSNYRATKGRLKPRMSIQHALELTKTIKTEAELNATYGPPNHVGRFNPGQGNEHPLNEFPRESWTMSEVFVPTTLIYTLPVGTKMLINRFDTAFYDGASGSLVAYVDKQGGILGWSYSVSLEDKHHYLADLPLWRGRH